METWIQNYSAAGGTPWQCLAGPPARRRRPGAAVAQAEQDVAGQDGAAGEEIDWTKWAAMGAAGALVLVTEWPQFRSPDIRKLHKGMRGDLVVDGRNMYIPAKARELGFRYVSVGRS